MAVIHFIIAIIRNIHFTFKVKCLFCFDKMIDITLRINLTLNDTLKPDNKSEVTP